MLLHVHTPLLILAAKKIFGLQPRDEAAMLVVVYNYGQYNKSIIAVNTIEFFFRRIIMKMELSSKGERCFCSWPPTWPPWRHVQTSNRFRNDILKQIKDVYNCCKLGVVLILVNEVQHRRMPVRTLQWRGENLSPPIEDYTWIKLNCNIKPR